MPPHPGPHAPPATAAAARDEALARGQLLLAVEDNPTNQRVIQHQLRLLGFVADFADDGLQGLERWRQGRYGLVLTDLHMPNLDGYQMVAAMRREEAASGRPRTPVVALTANAMKGQAEQCMAAGMDDFLAKPVALPRLKGVLAHWLGSPRTGQPAAPSTRDPDAAPAADPTPAAGSGPGVRAVDVGVLAALVGNKRSVLERFLNDYLRHGGSYQRSLLAALAGGDLREAGAAAHKLKSSSRSVGALALGELCERIEAAGRAGQLEAAVALAPLIESQWRQVSSEIETTLSAGATSAQDTRR